MPGTFSPLPRVSDPDIHHGTCRDASRDRYLAVSFDVDGRQNVPGIPSRMRNPRFCVSGKRPNKPNHFSFLLCRWREGLQQKRHTYKLWPCIIFLTSRKHLPSVVVYLTWTCGSIFSMLLQHLPNMQSCNTYEIVVSILHSQTSNKPLQVPVMTHVPHAYMLHQVVMCQ